MVEVPEVFYGKEEVSKKKRFSGYHRQNHD